MSRLCLEAWAAWTIEPLTKRRRPGIYSGPFAYPSRWPYRHDGDPEGIAAERKSFGSWSRRPRAKSVQRPTRMTAAVIFPKTATNRHIRWSDRPKRRSMPSAGKRWDGLHSGIPYRQIVSWILLSIGAQSGPRIGRDLRLAEWLVHSHTKQPCRLRPQKTISYSWSPLSMAHFPPTAQH